MVRAVQAWARDNLWLLGWSPARGSSSAASSACRPAALLVASKHQSIVGDLRAPDDLRRPDLRAQARADVDPALRLVRRQGRHGAGRPQAPASARSSDMNERAREEAAARPPDRHLPGRHPPPARRAAGLQVRRRPSLRQPRRALRADRARIPASTGRAAASSAGPARSVVEILEPIPPGLPRKEFMDELQTRLEAASARLLAEGTAQLKRGNGCGIARDRPPGGVAPSAAQRQIRASAPRRRPFKSARIAIRSRGR